MDDGLVTLVNMLHTKAGKIAAVSMAVERGITVDPNLLAIVPHGFEGPQNGNLSYPYSLTSAESLVDLGLHEGMVRRNIKRSIRYYTCAIHDLVTAREYRWAYELAEEHGLLPELERLFSKRISYLEAHGMFDDCVEIEALMGNGKREKMYRELVKILK